MKILMLGWELPPHNSGGLGIACYQLCKALAKKGADIEFILPYTARHDIDFMIIKAAHPQGPQALQASGGGAYDSALFAQGTSRPKYRNLLQQCATYEDAVGQIAQLGAYDVIHAHDWLTCRAAIRAKMVTGLPLIVHFHSIESDRAGRPLGGNPIVREIEQAALMIADRVVAVSGHTKQAIVREYGIDASKIAVAYNHIDPSDLFPEDTGASNAYAYLEYLKSQGWNVVSNVGRMTIQKGLTNLLRAFQMVVQHHPKTMLLLAGAGDQYHELVGLAADLGLARNVFFTGFERGKRCRDAFTCADLFVMPSVSEPFGFTALESMGYGTPLLISRQSGVAEIIKNCLKIDFWDVNGMADKIVGALQNQALRQEMSRQAEQEYRCLSWDDSVGTLLGIYRQHAEAAR